MDTAVKVVSWLAGAVVLYIAAAALMPALTDLQEIKLVCFVGIIYLAWIIGQGFNRLHAQAERHHEQVMSFLMNRQD